MPFIKKVHLLFRSIKPYKHNYERARRIMTQEAHAIIESLLSKDIKEVIILR